jgi:hypothetical protein
MNKPTTARSSAEAADAAPLRRSDIAAGRLVLRQRDKTGAD